MRKRKLNNILHFREEKVLKYLSRNIKLMVNSNLILLNIPYITTLIKEPSASVGHIFALELMGTHF